MASEKPRRFIIHQGWLDLKGGIYDESGQEFARLKGKLISLRAPVEVIESKTGALLFKIQRKLLAMRGTFDILSPEGQLLGRVKKKILALRPMLWLEDETGRRLLEARGDFAGYNFRITDMEGKEVARIDKLDGFEWTKRLLFGDLAPFFDRKDKYALEILDKSRDPMLLLAFVLAIDKLVHES